MESIGILGIALIIIALIIQGYYLRSVFDVSKHINNQEKQILLLTKIAEKLGVEQEKLIEIIDEEYLLKKESAEWAKSKGLNIKP